MRTGKDHNLRGASLVEYALGLSLLVAFLLVVVFELQRSGSRRAEKTVGTELHMVPCADPGVLKCPGGGIDCDLCR